MPNKHNTDRRHHIPKMQHRITNWPEYEAGLRSRGSLTLWITPDALAQGVGAWITLESLIKSIICNLC
jgi:hypothetical protein